MRARQQEVLQNFNPRSHERSDHKRQTVCQRCKRFQSTLPREERQSFSATAYYLCNFNPRSHERSDGSNLTVCLNCIQFQSTLPREERRNIIYTLWIDRISIHAPTRGATEQRIYLDITISTISIHAPTRGATKPKEIYDGIPHFNPRSHERSDGGLNIPGRHLNISIHAPTRGATVHFGYHS